jgi:uncharacterized phage protein (TIGR01671 family)
MREIKFRGYNKGWHYGYYVRMARALINGEVAINLYQCKIANYIIYDKDGQLNIVEIEDGSLGQSTGLKDKNGTEIYGGDIVQIWSETIPLYWEYKLLVQYFEDSAKFSLGKLDAREIVKVIGNIYENPELLDKD